MCCQPVAHVDIYNVVGLLYEGGTFALNVDRLAIVHGISPVLIGSFYGEVVT